MSLLLVAFGSGALGALVATSKGVRTFTLYFLALVVIGLAIYGLVMLSGRL